MIYYELATLHVTFAGAAAAPQSAARFCAAPDANGSLLGCFRSELGPVNKVVLLRSFGSSAELFSERERVRASPDPFFCGDSLTAMDIESYAPLPGFDAIEGGAYGSYYEIRTYRVRPGGLSRLVPEWVTAAPKRNQFSKLLMVMYGLDGVDRLTHIWPYASMEERTRARAEAAARCEGWPPPSGFRWFDSADMRTGIFIPTAESLLR